MGLILELEEASDNAGMIPDGTIYLAEVIDVALKERPAREPGADPIRRIEFKFRLITDDAHDGEWKWGSTSTKFVDHPNCHLKSWAEALLGRSLPARYKLDTDELIGCRCRAIISYRTWNDKNTGEPRERNEVQDVMPTKEAMTAIAEDDTF